MLIFSMVFFFVLKPVTLLSISMGSAFWFRSRDQRAFESATKVGLAVLAWLIWMITTRFAPAMFEFKQPIILYGGKVGEVIVWLCMIRIWFLHGRSRTALRAIDAVVAEKPASSSSMKSVFWIAFAAFVVVIAIILLGVLMHLTRRH